MHLVRVHLDAQCKQNSYISDIYCARIYRGPYFLVGHIIDLEIVIIY